MGTERERQQNDSLANDQDMTLLLAGPATSPNSVIAIRQLFGKSLDQVSGTKPVLQLCPPIMRPLGS